MKGTGEACAQILVSLTLFKKIKSKKNKKLKTALLCDRHGVRCSYTIESVN